MARGREPPAVRVQLVAPGQPALQAGAKQVDQPLGVAQLGVRHPVEIAVLERLAGTERPRRDDPAGNGILVLLAGAGLRLLGPSARRAGPVSPLLRLRVGVAILRRPGRPWRVALPGRRGDPRVWRRQNWSKTAS